MDNDQKRTLIAFLLIIIILLIWSYTTRPSSSKTSGIEKKKSQLSDTAKISPSDSDKSLLSGDTIVIEKDFYRATFSSAGGSLKSLYLKKYNVDIVPEGAYLFLTKISDTTINFKYIVDDDSIVFLQNINNKNFIKIYQFDQDYSFKLKLNYPDTISHILSLKSGLRITEKKNQFDDLRHFNAYIQSKNFNNITKEIRDRLIFQEDWHWIALRSKYFVLIINNAKSAGYPAFYKLSHLDKGLDMLKGNLGCAVSSNTNRYGVEIFANSSFELRVLFLPIKHSELAKFKCGYEQIEGGGIWRPIARLIISILNLFYNIFKNYGVAIIVFAFLLKIIFFPLSRQMLISQRQMQLLQPELKKIQEKYRNDPQALNREMMHLYKVYNVNPFSGCLPILIQFPIFVALYQVLSTSIEFRGAPFALWITDLSIKDPYYILPVGMGVLMLIQSLMTTIDPRQRFMVILMPLIMVFFFLNFPSGLQLYWFTYNILSILEQLMIKNKFLKLTTK
jgi:YidC/Oxa1 family membrane protein insertase